MMKKIALILMSIVLAVSFIGCAGAASGVESSAEPSVESPVQASGAPTSETATAPSSQSEEAPTSGFDSANEITVISREASSGTRGAFDELMGIIVKSGDTEEDMLFAEAIIVDSTDAVASKVEVDPYAIGYTSLGSVGANVRALSIDGVEATEANVKNGSYGISRPFVVATNGTAEGLAADFIGYITSAEGQAIVVERGYIAVDDAAAAYGTAAGSMNGKLVLGGSTSVEKVMEKLKESYVALHPDVDIEIQYTGSGTGIKDVQDGKVDIAMSSRALKEEEAAVLSGVDFALDGIAVIVNTENPLTEISGENVTKIFTGEVRTWDGIQ